VKVLHLTTHPYPAGWFPYSDKGTKLLKPFFADTRHQHQILYPSKRSMRSTVCDDSSGQHRPNAGKVFQLGGCAVIQIHDKNRPFPGFASYRTYNSVNGLDDLFPTKRRNTFGLLCRDSRAGLIRV
jgi:hypothetical protein